VTPKADIAMLTAELARVETAIRKQSPRYAELMQPRPLRWGAVQTLLDEKTVLFNYTLGAKRSFLWTITQDGVRSFILPPRSEIEALVKTAYNDISDSPNEQGRSTGFKQAADALSRMLLEPAAETIGSKKVIIVADGALQYLPFSSLPDPRTRATTKKPILYFNEIQFAPSASVVAVLRQEAERRPAPPRSVAIFADPVFSTADERFEDIKAVGRPAETRAVESLVSRELFVSRFLSRSNATGNSDIPRLPFSRREADAIFSNAPAGTSFKALDFEASREKAASIDLSKYGIVHFATHGILHSEHPELSGVVLSLFNEKGEPVNGFLRLNEIYNMKLNADLVVLSACQTALGKEVRGEGLIGLTRGFMYAGSPRVVASLWKVDDVATAELMKIFYQKMLRENMRPASALRAAKLEMMKQKRWSSPYFWAAFELQGEWR
jgi:CHAT domain-containing protein